MLRLLTAFALRLWGRWIGDSATAEEQQSGKAGLRAWFGTSNVAVSVAIVVLAWYGFDILPLLSAMVIGAILAAYPVVRMETPTMSATPQGTTFPPSGRKSWQCWRRES